MSSYLLLNKNKESVLKNLKSFFNNFGSLKELGTDNGKEFINDAVKNFLNGNDIKLMNGRPYNPNSQGAVERIHITLRKSLLSFT